MTRIHTSYLYSLFFALVTAGLLSVAAYSPTMTHAADIFPTQQCTQTASGVEVMFASAPYTLTNGCVDTGAARQHVSYTCLSATSYEIQTAACEEENIPETPTTTPDIPDEQTPTTTPNELPDADGCGAHGWLHISHCHCDSGYVQAGTPPMCIAIETPTNDDSLMCEEEHEHEYTNPTNVQIFPAMSCTATDHGIRVGFGLAEQTLTNGCQLTDGQSIHYTYQCVSSNQYEILTEACQENQSDTENQCQSEETDEQTEQPSQQNNNQSSGGGGGSSGGGHSQSEQTGTCGAHGWLHGDHCHCDAGYVEVNLQCVPPQTNQSGGQGGGGSGSPSTTTSTAHSISEQTGTCGAHGWLHGDHCHCDSGYTAVNMICVSLNTNTSTPSSATSTDALLLNDADGCGLHGFRHEDHCDCDTGYHNVNMMCVVIAPPAEEVLGIKIEETTATATPTKPVLACSGHGTLHGDHCHCDTGYTGKGITCVKKTVSPPVKPIKKVAVLIPSSTEKQVPSDTINTGRTLLGDQIEKPASPPRQPFFQKCISFMKKVWSSFW